MSPQQVRFAWQQAAAGYVLETTSALNNSTVWSPVATPPQGVGSDFAVTISLTSASQFFRLRGPPLTAFTTIAETSPARGETGVAVTRETIVRFTGALSPAAQVTTEEFFAEFGGRKILSRVHVAPDRRTLTLFYLEPLPASARIRVTLEGDTLSDAQGRAVDLDGDGLPGGTATFDFDTLSITPVGRTAMIGRVFASELVTGTNGKPSSVNRPLSGVTITVVGAEQLLRTRTDALGNFKLQPCPAGRFFVEVDGRTADGSQWPNGAYYPIVGKAWEAIAGREDNLAAGTGEIYLPLIRQGTLQTVSVTNSTVVSFPPSVISSNPALAGVSITIPANSLFSDNGVRGGKVGIAPVAPDRLPEPLPQGLNFPLVITIQTDGPSNFDRPIPVRFPNLPDPVTGLTLPPGAKSTLWSFNHDTGRWEIQGSMTVSADGKFVDSDPGVGVRQPGWHAPAPVVVANSPGPIGFVSSSVGPIAGGPPCGTNAPGPPPPPRPPITVRVDSVIIGPASQSGSGSAQETIYSATWFGFPTNASVMAGPCSGTTPTPVTPAGSQPPRLPRPGPASTQVSFRQSMPRNVNAWQDLNGTSYLLSKDGEQFALEFANNDPNANGPDLFVTVDTEGFPEDFLDGFSSGAYIIQPGHKTVIVGSARPLAPFTNPQNAASASDVIQNDQLFVAKVRVEATELSAPFRILVRQEFYVLRYFDASDPAPNDDVLDFQKAVPGLVVRSRNVDVTGGYLFSSPIENQLVTSAPFSVTNDAGQLKLLFAPQLEQRGGTSTLTIKEPRGPVAGTLQLRGDADITTYYIETTNFNTAVAAYNIQKGENRPADIILQAMRNELRRLFDRVGGVLEASTATGADIIVDDFLVSIFYGGDAMPVLRSGTSKRYLKDFDFIGTDKATHNDAQFAYLFTRALNRRFVPQGLKGSEFVEADLFHVLDLFLRGPNDNRLAGEHLAQSIARSIGHHIGLVELVSYASGGDRYWVDPNQDTNNGPVFWECLAPFLEGPVMGYQAGDSICELYAWRTALGFGDAADLEKTYLYFLDYASFGEVAPLDPTFFRDQFVPFLPFPPPLESPVRPPPDTPVVSRPASALVIDPLAARAITERKFGTVAADGPAGQLASAQLRLVNTGSEPLTILETRLQTSAGFTLATVIPPGLVIPGGGIVPFTVRFDPQIAGEHRGNIVFATDVSPGFLVLHLSGTGVSGRGEIQISVARNNAGGAALSAPAARLTNFARVKNIGQSPLNVRAVNVRDGAAHFAVSGLPAGGAQLAPGAGLDLNLAFDPGALGLLNGTIEVLSDDRDSPASTFTVVGTGLPDTGPQPEWGRDFVFIESGKDFARLRSDAAGNFVVDLPAAQPYSVQVFDPISGLVWFGANVSSPAGQATQFGIPVFRASTANDFDFNGLPDDIDRILGPGRRIDFGTDTSPVTPGYTRATAQSYSPATGYGWIIGGVGAVDRGPANDLSVERDFNETADGTFVVDLPNNVYEVSFTLGDRASARPGAQVYLENELVTLASTVLGEAARYVTRVVVSDGQLTLRLRSSSGGQAAIMALEIAPLLDSFVPAPSTPPLSGPFAMALENLDARMVSRNRITVAADGNFPQAILLPGTHYRQWTVHLATLQSSVIEFTTPGAGSAIDRLPTMFFGPANAPDADADSLDDIVEFVLGTNPNRADTDGDGLSDRAELDAGFNPLSAVIASAPVSGRAIDVCAENNAAIVASDTGNVSIFNVFNDLAPVLIGAVDTPGNSPRVACSGNLIAVADGGQGVAVIDFSDPPAARITHQVQFANGAQALAVAAANDLAYVGLSSGEIAEIDLRGGFVLGRVGNLGGPVQDVAIHGDDLFALAGGNLRSLNLRGGPLQVRGSAPVPPGATRLFVGGGIAYVSLANGLNTYSVSNPASPALLASSTGLHPSWRAFVANGTGRGLAAAGNGGSEDLQAYDLTDPARLGPRLAELVTPGGANSLTLFNGLAYVADGGSGLQVMNYVSPDTNRQPPTITLAAGFSLSPAQVEEGQRTFFGARARDDVQVRSVEFFIDGVLVSRDGSFPFEHQFTTPLRRDQTSFRIQARATDTGGNVATTAEIIVNVLSDTTAPVVRGTSPLDGDFLRNALDTILVAFAERIDAAQLPASPMQVFGAGSDGQLGTADDVLISGGVLSYRSEIQALQLDLRGNPLSSGSYRVVVAPGIHDLAGNRATATNTWQFTITDLIKPSLLATSPMNAESVVSPVTRIVAVFDEAIAPATLNATAFTLKHAGADRLLGTADDQFVPGTIRFATVERTASLELSAPLPPQAYEVFLSGAVTDLAGIRLGSDVLLRFAVPIPTTVQGLVRFENGSPAIGANVALESGMITALADAAGRFIFPGAFLDPVPTLAARASLSAQGRKFVGRVSGLVPVPNGVTDVGVITLREVCDPRTELVTTGANPIEGFRALALFDAGNGPELYAAGRSSSIPLGGLRGVVARFDGRQWQEIGSFNFTNNSPGLLFGEVNALLEVNDASGKGLIAAGRFTSVNGQAANHVARWNGASWQALGSGIQLVAADTLPSVNALALFNDGSGVKLAAGGNFRVNNSTNIALLNGATWTTLGTGAGNADSEVSALAVFADAGGAGLFAGGTFTNAGGTTANHIARWRSGAWSAVGGGVSATNELEEGAAAVNALAVGNDGRGNALFVGGRFARAGTITANSIARWDGANWTTLDSGVSDGFGNLSTVTALFSQPEGPASTIYASGDFNQAGTLMANTNFGGLGLARWKSGRWEGIDGSLQNPPGRYNGAEAVLADGTGASAKVYVGGGPRVGAATAFGGSGPALIGVLNMWQGGQWRPVGQPIDGQVQALTVFHDGQSAALYAAGQFTAAGNSITRNILKWDGREYQPLGGGVHSGDDPNARVYVLQNFNSPDGPRLMAGGQFTQAGNIVVTNLAAWTGSNWVSPGGGVFGRVGLVEAYVGSMTTWREADTNWLVVAGAFSRAGDINATSIAAWNGRSWRTFGGGLSGPNVSSFVEHVTTVGADLYAASALGFRDPSGRSLGRVARWDGRNWQAVGTGNPNLDPTGDNFLSIIGHDDGSGPALFVNAHFRDGYAIAKWTGVSWQFLLRRSEGFEPSVTRSAPLASFDDGNGPALYVLSSFVEGNVFQAPRLGRWTPLGWEFFQWTGPPGYGFETDALHPSALLGSPSLYTPANGFNGMNLGRWYQPPLPCPPGP